MNRTISSRRHIAFNINIYYSLRFGFGLPFVAARSSRLVVFVSGSGCAVQSLLIIVYKELVLVFCLLSSVLSLSRLASASVSALLLRLVLVVRVPCPFAVWSCACSVEFA